MISAKLLSDYRKALTTVVESANESMAKVFHDAVGKGLAESEIRDVMIEAAWEITNDFGNLSAATAADFYDAIRVSEMGGSDVFRARLADLPDFAAIQKQGHMSARFMYDRAGKGERVYKADVDVFFREFTTNIERLILDAARDTISTSGTLDPKRPLAAVIAQPGACRYCQGAMSDGWRTPATVGRATGIFHDNCRCITAPSWDRSPNIEGVDHLSVLSGVTANPF